MSDQLARILDTGLGWLFDTVQPDDAHTSHHGISLHLPGNRWYGFHPTGARNRPVVSTNVAKTEYAFDSDSVPANPLEPGELDALVEELSRRGHAVDTTWNGHPSVSGSVGLACTAHPTLVAAVDRYRRGCTVHPARGVFCDCDSWTAGFRRVVQPERMPATP